MTNTNECKSKSIKSKSKSKKKVNITDFYTILPDDLKKKYHNPNYESHLIKLPFRMLVVACSGGGKTNFALECIQRMNGTFEEIIICLKSKHEPLYEYLERQLGSFVRFYENCVPSMDEFKDKGSEQKQRLIIFDDLVVEKALNKTISDYFIRGRKFNFSMMYLSQTFYGIPKIIRQNANYVVLKKVASDKDIKMICREFSIGLNIDQLMELYKECTKTKLNFLLLSLDDDATKFRKNFIPIQL